MHLPCSTICLLLIPVVLASSCRYRHEKQEIEAAMQTYDRLIKKMDADSIALLYAPDGDLGGVAKGRESIRNFLSGFKNVDVLSQTSSTASITVKNDSATQKGSYHQVVLVDQKDTVTVSGTYSALWVFTEGSWHIKSMATKPEIK